MGSIPGMFAVFIGYIIHFCIHPSANPCPMSKLVIFRDLTGTGVSIAKGSKSCVTIQYSTRTYIIKHQQQHQTSSLCTKRLFSDTTNKKHVFTTIICSSNVYYLNVLMPDHPVNIKNWAGPHMNRQKRFREIFRLSICTHCQCGQ